MTTHVLLVDDDEVVGETLTEYLREEGYTVHFAPSGPAALTLAQRLPLDLVVSDIRMPGMSGFTLGHELRRLYQLPVLLMSGYCDPADRAGIPVQDKFDFLAKPFTPDELVNRIGGLLTRSVLAG